MIFVLGQGQYVCIERDHDEADISLLEAHNMDDSNTSSHLPCDKHSSLLPTSAYEEGASRTYTMGWSLLLYLLYYIAHCGCY